METEALDKYQPFVYPTEQHIRRHGPSGYINYESYRDWLRDDFAFRCVFCLRREQWDIMNGKWDIDHFIPQCIHPDGVVDYSNLLYVCHSCNITKTSSLVPDPCKVVFGNCLMVQNNGHIVALNEDGELLIETLRLNSKHHNNWRYMLITTFYSLSINGETETLALWFRYPEDLPDLSNRRPVENTKPQGINDSYYERRKRNELPDIY